MASQAELVLAVAGSRKTQGIVEECANAPLESRILILTYTTNNQNELKSRIATYAGDHHKIEIQGWFAFLIKQIARPFLPFAFSDRKLRGFDFYTPPQQFQATTSATRYLSTEDKAFRVHLPQLAFYVHTKSNGCWLDRLSRLYDVIYIDEVQDLCGYDLEILSLLIDSGIRVRMVGDIRQAVIATNIQEAKNKQYMFTRIWKWFRELENEGRITIRQRCETWRCRQEIATFADALFDPEWGFEKTVSQNNLSSGHDGLFLVSKSDLPRYMAQFRPLLLRYNASSGREMPFDFMNYKESKGLSVKRVCILPTGPVEKYLMGRGTLKIQQSAELYVAVTRAEQSVCFILDKAGRSSIPRWIPD